MEVLNSIRSDPKLLFRALRDPTLIGLGLNRTYHEYTQKGAAYNGEGTDIVTDEDWDNLIVLDACRDDVYRELTPFGGSVETRQSRGSASKQWVRGNFDGKTLHDTVAISGNQWYLDLREELECELHAYHDVERDAANGFVPSPEAVTKTAMEQKDNYPNKRLLIHYMQPHHPYLRTDVEGFRLVRKGLRGYVRASDVTVEKVRAAYRDNLRYALEHVERLVEALDGKTVITADHGEMLGERLSPLPVRWFGHPPGIYTEQLVRVPWHVVSNESRRTITSDPPEENRPGTDRATVKENLKDLGYM